MTQLDRVVASLRSEQNERRTAFASSQVSRAAFDMEGVNDTLQHELNSSVQSLSTALEQIISEHGLSKDLTVAHRHELPSPPLGDCRMQRKQDD
ncbi:hypothetical protein AWB68_08066 [Caballeronia choica]|uniref:Uncharacterized protein n=1 Tax=Caballeronia choica TaxID=326476 RepID=A0A158L0M1_9BURK|nr:hypothetical protein [Caballeronia choica]SAL86549.1 hypothetical protein AWB68_08066 [Caballeronia choica]